MSSTGTLWTVNEHKERKNSAYCWWYDATGQNIDWLIHNLEMLEINEAILVLVWNQDPRLIPYGNLWNPLLYIYIQGGTAREGSP